MAIKFGTSGWRAVIADGFTFASVRRVTQAICRYLQASGASSEAALVVSYDTRFLGEKFAEQCVGEVAAAGYRAIFCDHATPTPTISHTIRDRKAAGGINFTASHNSPEYNGMKFSTADGAPALPEVTKRVEQFIGEMPEGGAQGARRLPRPRSRGHRLPLGGRGRGGARHESGRATGRALPARRAPGVGAHRRAPDAGRAGALSEKLKQEPGQIGGRRVARRDRADGVKFILDDGSWLLLRPSGTEPLVRIYAESESAQDLEVLLEQGRKYLLG
jgi:phosphomannomutase